MPETPKFTPAALVAFALSPIVLVIAVLVAIVGALWWFGIDWRAIAAGVIVLALAAAIFFGGVYLARRRNERAVDATIAGMTDAIGAEDNSPQSRERVVKLRGKWERLFKNVRPEYIKSKPILMIMGESKSGKSVLLDKSGLELESGNREERDWEEGTENVDPWFFPDGLVLDTAGEMLVSAGGGARIDWKELVKLIKTLRPRNPVSGVILAVPVWRLQSEDEAERIKQANLIQKEFQRLVQMFGVRFPVSVVVTMADLVDGYSEFALRQSAARPGDKYTILGWPQYQLSDEFGGRDVMAESVAGVTARIDAQVLYDTCNPETAAAEGVEALEIWCLPKHIRTIGQRLADYLKIVFREKQSERVANAPFFRGVFFGSAMQAIRKGEPRRKEPERPRSEPFNIRDLLAIRLFGEAGLVTTSPRAEAAARTRRLVGIVVPLAVAALSAAVALISFDLAGRVEGQKDALVEIRSSLEGRNPWISKDGKADVALAGLLAAQFSNARDLRATDLPARLSWYGGFAKQRLEKAESATERAWTKLVAMPLLEAAANEKAWSTSSGAYRELALEGGEGKGKDKAPTSLNPNLLTLDQALVDSLRAAGATTDGPRLRDGQSQKSNGTPARSLAPLLRAMTGTTSDFERLLDIKANWAPPGAAIEHAKGADALRAKFLVEKFEAAVDPLLVAADTHAAWSGATEVEWSATSRESGLSWNKVIDEVWSLFDGLGQSPSDRLAKLESWIETPPSGDAKKIIFGLDKPDELTRRVESIKTLSSLYSQSRDLDFPAMVDAIVARSSEVQGAGYEPGKLGEAIGLDLNELAERHSLGKEADSNGSGGSSQTQPDLREFREYAEPAIAHFVESVARFLAEKVTHATAEDAGTPDSNRPGSLAPISDFRHVKAASLLESFQTDVTTLRTWLENRARPTDQRFTDAQSRLNRLVEQVAESTKSWTVVADSGFGPGEPATAKFVEAVLRNGDKTVAEIAVEVAEQAARLSGQSDEQIRSATAESERETSEHKALREALAQLAAGASPPGPAGVRDRAARFVADLSPSAGSGGANDPFAAISNGVKAVEKLKSADEKQYWSYFWRDVLMEAAKLRDDDQNEDDRFVQATSSGFPLPDATTTTVPPSDVLRLAEVGTASPPGAQANVALDRRTVASLEDLLNHRQPAAVRTKPQKEAIETAALLAGMPAASVADAFALRVTVQATGDRRDLPLGGEDGAFGVEFDSRLADADKNNWNGSHQLIISANGCGGPDANPSVRVDSNAALQGLTGQWGVETPSGSINLQFGTPKAVEGKNREVRGESSLPGGGWAALRLASELKPIKKDAQELTLRDGFLWGALPANEGADILYVYVGVKLEWVLNDGKTQPVDIAGWLKKMKPN
jgi:hypothetical protein